VFNAPALLFIMWYTEAWQNVCRPEKTHSETLIALTWIMRGIPDAIPTAEPCG